MLFTRLPISNNTVGLPVVNTNDISNYPAWRDATANMHWLPKISGIVDPISGVTLGVGTTPVPALGSNILTSPNSTAKALRPGVLDAGAWTVGCVFRLTGAVSGLGQILGNLTGSVGIGIFVGGVTGYLTSRSGGYSSLLMGTVQTNTWYYAAISVNRVQPGTRVIFGTASSIGNGLVPLVGENIGIGNSNYASMSGNQNILEVAEITVYRSLRDLEVLRTEARARMLLYAGITVA